MADRGYGYAHKQLRKRWALKVDRGGVDCARCGRPIVPGTPWDLGHDDHDRSKYSGPEHAGCNRATAARGRGEEIRVWWSDGSWHLVSGEQRIGGSAEVVLSFLRSKLKPDRQPRTRPPIEGPRRTSREW